MAAPAHTLLSAYSPAGIKMPNGFSSVIVFARLPTASFWVTIEGGYKPGGLDGGEPVLQSDMLNIGVHTKRPRVLVMHGDTVVTAAYDPNLRKQMEDSLLNAEGSITEYMSDGSYLDYYGYLQKAEFGELKEGQLPLVTLTVVKTNWDPVGRVLVKPVFFNVTGT